MLKEHFSKLLTHLLSLEVGWDYCPAGSFILSFLLERIKVVALKNLFILTCM